MNLGRYTKYSIITLCGLLLFFLGASLPFQTDLIALVTLLAIVLLTVGISYKNGTPLGGLILGIFASSSFLLGFFLMTCVWELSTTQMIVIGPVGREFGLILLEEVLYSYGSGMLSAVIAFASLGLFFGLLGYVYRQTSTQITVKQLHVFRDYWSSIHQLGKSDRREYSSLDRKLSSWSIRKKIWWKKLVEKLTETQPDLVFTFPYQKKTSHELNRGDLFDLSSGRMIGNDLIDPSDLTSKYRPMVLKVAETSSSPKGVRRLALEELLSRFLKWFIPSRAVWILYLILSGVLVCSVYNYWTPNLSAYAIEVDSYEPTDVIDQALPEGLFYPVVASSLIASIVTLFFVWRWRKSSKELFNKRPDERILIFVVYIILTLLYGFYFDVIIEFPPARPEAWVESWFIWTRWLILFTVILSIGYIFIHRECEAINTYFYYNRSPTSHITSPLKKPQDEPFWLKKDKVKAYWVLRFMYFWRFEVAKVPHSDWERVEAWVDAEKGDIKWIVTDYHYRELWYKVKGDLSKIYIKFLINFHTPIPVFDSSEAESISYVFNLTMKELIKIVASGRSSKIIETIRAGIESSSEVWTKLHPSHWIENYGLTGQATRFCSNLPWTYWRYPKGLEKPKIYLEEPAALLKDQPKLLMNP